MPPLYLRMREAEGVWVVWQGGIGSIERSVSPSSFLCSARMQKRVGRQDVCMFMLSLTVLVLSIKQSAVKLVLHAGVVIYCFKSE